MLNMWELKQMRNRKENLNVSSATDMGMFVSSEFGIVQLKFSKLFLFESLNESTLVVYS